MIIRRIIIISREIMTCPTLLNKDHGDISSRMKPVIIWNEINQQTIVSTDQWFQNFKLPKR